MAVKTKWDITFGCGHTEERDLSHKPAGKRAGFANWLARQDECSDCFKKNNKDEIAAKQLEAALQNQKPLGLPDLDGTESQLKWAPIFRNELIVDAHDALVDNGDMTDEDFDSRILGPARTIVRAGWWMDNIESAPTDLEELVTTAGDEPGNVTENPY